MRRMRYEPGGECEQDEVELDGMKKGADSTGKVMHANCKVTACILTNLYL